MRSTGCHCMMVLDVCRLPADRHHNLSVPKHELQILFVEGSKSSIGVALYSQISGSLLTVLGALYGATLVNSATA